MPTDPDSACEGDCHDHVGVPVRVHVSAASYDWGWWIYCETARKTDRAAGFTVTEAKQEDGR
ncbi:hypothetical protein LCGC14_0723100 [marine sediment metagenome]|uniref:Uncharacterized protein n=1 Tax=marine sediment metagenome TaxID=412755 RepID=A0A0F9QFY7_9ZZZZ